LNDCRAKSFFDNKKRLLRDRWKRCGLARQINAVGKRWQQLGGAKKKWLRNVVQKRSSVNEKSSKSGGKKHLSAYDKKRLTVDERKRGLSVDGRKKKPNVNGRKRRFNVDGKKRKSNVDDKKKRSNVDDKKKRSNVDDKKKRSNVDGRWKKSSVEGRKKK